MARIQFSAMIEEIVGKLAGSVFQDSYMGMQIRTRVSPQNPQTEYQQLRRGEFGYIAQRWRTLTSTEQMTWITAAGSIPQAVRLFIQVNVNLSLIEIPIISSYTAGPLPDPFPLDIITLDGIVFEVQAPVAPYIVPAGTTLLLFATYEKKQTKIFTNPSEFSPIASFPAGTDFTGPIDILALWEARYGVIHNNLRLCIKTVVIDNTNGARSADSIQCVNEPVIETYYIIDDTGNRLIDSDGTLIISQ